MAMQTLLILLEISREGQGLMDGVLTQTLTDMRDMSTYLVDVARAIAVLGALLYISARVWRSLASAEPIDVYPLLRPFAILLCLGLYPHILDGFDRVLQPIEMATAAMSEAQRQDVDALKAQYKKLSMDKIDDRMRKEISDANPQQEEQLSKHKIVKEDISLGTMLLDKGFFWVRRIVFNIFEAFLQFAFEVAGLVIKMLRVFCLIVLSIIGPLVLGFSVFDGFTSGLTSWIARYISIYLWAPICSILTAIMTRIRAQLLTAEISNLQGAESSDSNWLILAFYAIGIIAFLSVPTIAGWVVEAGGGAGGMLRNSNSLGRSAGRYGLQKGNKLAAVAGARVGNVVGKIRGKKSMPKS